MCHHPPRGLLPLGLVGDPADRQEMGGPGLQEQPLQLVNFSDISGLRGAGKPPLELAACYLSLAPGYLFPCRRCPRLAHDFCTLLGGVTSPSIVRPSAYPSRYSKRWLLTQSHPRRLAVGTSSKPTTQSGEHVQGYCVPDSSVATEVGGQPLPGCVWGECAARGDVPARHPVPFGSSVTACCAGSTSRQLHCLPVRPRLHRCLRRPQARLPAAPRVFPLHGLRTSRSRGE